MSLERILDFSWATNAGAWIGLITLIALEIVLGIDNIVFISILSGKLPKEQQPSGRRWGITLAVIPRILLLLALPFVLSLDQPLFTLPFPDPENSKVSLGLSIQDLIVVVGGLFLLWKATHEIHERLEGETAHDADAPGGKGSSFTSVLVQIMLLNIVFSLDSIITAIGMVPKEQVMVMILAVLISTVVMAFSVNVVSGFVERHPTVKMLALSFLLLIGMTLLIEGFHGHVPKGYVYFAMGFSVLVEMLNLRASAKRHSQPVHLHGPHLP